MREERLSRGHSLNRKNDCVGTDRHHENASRPYKTADAIHGDLCSAMSSVVKNSELAISAYSTVRRDFLTYGKT